MADSDSVDSKEEQDVDMSVEMSAMRRLNLREEVGKIL